MKLGFISLMRAGKDTAAEYLVEKFGGQIIKFADPLYWIQSYAQEITGFPRIKDRQMLQWLGTEWGRTKDPDIWVKILLRRIQKSKGNIFVTDVRFENEVELLRKNGFKIVQILATDEIRSARGATLETHISEQFARSFETPDIRFENNGTKEEYYEKLTAQFGG